ncbi:sequestosome-1 isoform X3 [Pieris rapae]|uniref:sequestosome-1 isoform X3 n=1 Tax=Pieris rapae TaxID=64459 RepID=UPI001E27B17F|nr:sequestosome-1 isoform X3 [Pieris rapae]
MFALRTTMEVQFKVFTFWNENDKPEVRRFGIDKSVVTSFQYLNAKLQDVFPKLKGKTFSVLWKDEEGDDVMISSDDEIMIALTSMSDDLKKLYVFCKYPQEQHNECDIVITAVADNSQENPLIGSSNIVHNGVVCDGCDSPVTGFRYNCTYCDDYDLCSKCEAAGMHPEHCMVRVPVPSLPRPMIKAAVKRSRSFLKSLRAVEEQCKKQRHEGEKHRENAHGHGHGHGHGHRRQGRDDQRRKHISWLDVVASYLNEYSNLAGDIGLNAEKSSANQENVGQNASKSQEATSSAASGENPKPPQCPFSSDKANIGNFIRDYMKGLATPSTSKQDVEMGHGDGKTEKNEKSDGVISKAPEDSTSKAAESKKDESPDRTDGWTVINKDVMETEPKGTEPERPIGFNLPEEFQERVRINEGQSLYPPLNTATAEAAMEQAAKPSAPEEPKKETAKPKGADSKPKDAKPETAPHPIAHIQAALDQMISMGFTNEANWLTQLLETKDGNISAVLDLLTPTNPKK